MPVLRNQWNPKRLAIEIVEQNAISSPDKVFAEIPRSASDFEQGFQSITYVDLANAVNGVAWYLRNLFGSPDNIETLTYIGPNDLSHVLLILGAVKAGFKVSPFILSKKRLTFTNKDDDGRCSLPLRDTVHLRRPNCWN